MATCRACFGSGDANACGRDHGMSSCVKHYCCHCEQTSEESANAGSCSACHGSGQQREEILTPEEAVQNIIDAGGF